MTNNHEEHEHEDFVEHEAGLSDEPRRQSMTGNLAEAWRTRPLFKFLVLIGAVFAVSVAGVSFFGGANKGDELAHLAKPPSLNEAPGGAASPYMRQQTELANKARSDQAIANGGSAMPSPIGQSTDVEAPVAKDTQLNELRAETENLKKQVQQQQVQQQQAQQQPRQPEQFDNSMAEAMQRQLQQLMEGWAPKGIKNVTVVKSDAQKGEEGIVLKEPRTGDVRDQNLLPSSGQGKIVVSAGTVSYAQLLTEANSDVPGPILAQIVSGPLAGARAVGSFQVTNNYEKYLVLKFNIADKKGKDYTINAIALDPDTTLGGMATEVDERYVSRVLLPAAAGFLQGMGQALSTGQSSITTNGTTSISTQAGNGYKQGIYNGMSLAAQTMGQFFQNQANLTKPLVRVAAGTPMGLFFVAPVRETTDGEQDQPNGRGPNGGYGVPNNGYYGASYPGATVTGYGAAAQNAASGVPYPNYATPGGGYGYGNVNNRMPNAYGNAFGGAQYSPNAGYPNAGYGQ